MPTICFETQESLLGNKDANQKKNPTSHGSFIIISSSDKNLFITIPLQSGSRVIRPARFDWRIMYRPVYTPYLLFWVKWEEIPLGEK